MSIDTNNTQRGFKLTRTQRVHDAANTNQRMLGDQLMNPKSKRGQNHVLPFLPKWYDGATKLQLEGCFSHRDYRTREFCHLARPHWKKSSPHGTLGFQCHRRDSDVRGMVTEENNITYAALLCSTWDLSAVRPLGSPKGNREAEARSLLTRG